MMDHPLFSLALTRGNVENAFPDSVLGSASDGSAWPDDMTPPRPHDAQYYVTRATRFIAELLTALSHKLFSPEGREFLQNFHLRAASDGGLKYRHVPPAAESPPLPGPEDRHYWQTTYDTVFAQYELLWNTKGLSSRPVDELPSIVCLTRLDPLFGICGGHEDDGAFEREVGQNARVEGRKHVAQRYLKKRVDEWASGVMLHAPRTLW